MPPAVALSLSALENQKAEILASLAAWPASQLTYRPTPTAWSAAEVLDHVVRVEREILAAALRGVVTPRRRGVRDRVGFVLLDWLFRSKRRVRVPTSVPEVLPSPNADLVTAERRSEADHARHCHRQSRRARGYGACLHVAACRADGAPP
jgi:hypothetical protein